MRRGFTLAEVMVVLFLLAAVLGLVAQLLVPSLTLFARQSSHADAQQSLLAALGHIRRDVIQTRPETVTLSYLPAALSLEPLSETGTPYGLNGTPQLANYMVIYWLDPASRRLWRKQRPLPGPPPVQLSVTQLQTLAPSSDPQDRVVGRYLTRFELPAGGLVTFPLRIRLTATVETAREPAHYTMEVTLDPRNSAR